MNRFRRQGADQIAITTIRSENEISGSISNKWKTTGRQTMPPGATLVDLAQPRHQNGWVAMALYECRNI